MLESQQESIAMNILGNKQVQSIDQQMEIWCHAQIQEEERLAELQSLKKEAIRQKEQWQQERVVLEEENKQLHVQATECRSWQEYYQKTFVKVKHTLSLCKEEWERLPSVHETKDTIFSLLHEGIDQKDNYYNELAYQERLAFRYVDDYEKQEEFFADPQVMKWVNDWRDQFTLLQTGVEFISSWEQPLTEARLWAITLVTLEKEKDALMDKLLAKAELLSFPIRILTIEEAQAILKNTGPLLEWENRSWIEPAHFAISPYRDRFESWKIHVNQIAQKAKNERSMAEQECKRWRDALQVLDDFLMQYPLGVVSEQDSLYKEIQKKCDRSERRLGEIDKELLQTERGIEKMNEEDKQLSQQMLHTNICIRDGKEYQKITRKRQELLQKSGLLSDQIDKVEREIKGIEQRLEELQEQKIAIAKQQASCESEQSSLIDRDIFKEVEDELPIETNMPYSALVTLRESLREQRLGIMQEKTALESKLQDLHAQEKEATHTMRNLQVEEPKLNVDLQFPTHVDKKIDDAVMDVKNKEMQEQEINQRWHEKEKQCERKAGEIQVLIDEFHKKYEDATMIVFAEPLNTITVVLNEERKHLDKRREECERLVCKNEENIEIMQRVSKQWDQIMGKHQLDHPLLTIVTISEQEEQTIRYHLQEQSEGLIQQLSEQRDVFDKQTEIKSKKLREFNRFCQREIHDVRLQQMAERGVETVENYQDLLGFVDLIDKRLTNAIQVMKEQLQTENTKLEQFIRHIQDHMMMIVDEMKELPKSTRVRTATGSKDIFEFKIPTWNEPEGRARIRDHIDWIVTQVSQTKYRDASGKEDAQLVRKDLEKWFDSRQLLQKIMPQGAKIRISCRKVTNEQQVSSASFSWEESNRWSGGEMWSKNMTLFLGILNYVAKKRQPIQSTMKTHRVVLLDNPFGKASSDHVLTPVFYIAEQLGFQLITLTAHVEGKFLEDFFPIVYSCRLRVAASGRGKQIVEPIHHISHAYFRDLDPKVLDRIVRLTGGITQEELF
nr:hypothetical protein [Bacilli bacterium]